MKNIIESIKLFFWSKEKVYCETYRRGLRNHLIWSEKAINLSEEEVKKLKQN